MKFYLYKNSSGNYNISYPSEYFKSRQRCEHSGSLQYLQEQIQADILQTQGILNDSLACLVFSSEELQNLQKDIEIMQRTIKYIEGKKVA